MLYVQKRVKAKSKAKKTGRMRADCLREIITITTVVVQNSTVSAVAAAAAAVMGIRETNLSKNNRR